MTQIMSKGVGIDLGTTNSVVAVMNPSDTEIILHRDKASWATTPSCAWQDPGTGETHVGRRAVARTGYAPPPVRSVKRLMGTQQRVPFGSGTASPEDISSLILTEMKRQIEEDVAGWSTSERLWAVDRAIVTVPAYFDQPQIDATRRAAEQAGIDLLDLLHEPTAAACYHCWRTNTQAGTFLVYDLGGGTFDVSVVRATAGTFEILGISGNTHLGGDEIDTAMANAIAERLRDEGYAMDLDPANDPADQARFTQLRLMAESTKKALSVAPEHVLNATVTDRNGTPVLVEMLWDRRDLEALARPFIDLTLGYCADAIEIASAKDASVTLGTIDEVILAGGSTHMPLVRQILARELCSPTSGPVPGRARCAAPTYKDVDTIVALGAAVRAAETGGLHIYDDRRTVRLALRGIGSLADSDASVNGTVTPLADGLHVEGGTVRMAPADDPDDADEAAIGSGGNFSLTDLPVEPGKELDYVFEILDAAGDAVATLGHRIAHLDGEQRKPTGGAGTSSKLSKAVLLEVDRQGRAYRKALVPAMSNLPVAADFEFTHLGGAETVLLPIYQRRKLIKTIRVPVPADTPAGTPIHLSVSIDQFATITVRGTIADISFDAAIEQPPDRPVPTTADIQDIERRFRETAIYLPAGKRTVAEARWDMTRAALDAAITAFDDTGTIYQFEELEDLLDVYDRGDNSLDPPKTKFDQLAEECERLNQSVREPAREEGIPHDYDDVARNIAIQRSHGDQAFRDADQHSYSEAARMLEDIHRMLKDISANIASTRNNKRPPEEVAAADLKATEELASKVLDMAREDERGRFIDEVEAIRAHLAGLRDKVATQTVFAQHKIDQHWGRLSQIKNALDDKTIESAEVLASDNAVGDSGRKATGRPHRTGDGADARQNP